VELKDLALRGDGVVGISCGTGCFQGSSCGTFFLKSTALASYQSLSKSENVIPREPRLRCKISCTLCAKIARSLPYNKTNIYDLLSANGFAVLLTHGCGSDAEGFAARVVAEGAAILFLSTIPHHISDLVQRAEAVARSSYLSAASTSVSHHFRALPRSKGHKRPLEL